MSVADGAVKTLTVVINEFKKYIISRSNCYSLLIVTTVKSHILSSTLYS